MHTHETTPSAPQTPEATQNVASAANRRSFLKGTALVAGIAATGALSAAAQDISLAETSLKVIPRAVMRVGFDMRSRPTFKASIGLWKKCCASLVVRTAGSLGLICALAWIRSYHLALRCQRLAPWREASSRGIRTSVTSLGGTGRTPLPGLPGNAAGTRGPRDMLASSWRCTGPITYIGGDAITRDIANFTAALRWSKGCGWRVSSSGGGESCRIEISETSASPARQTAG
jgi:hypothetical protein